jgi:hypothetical protein
VLFGLGMFFTFLLLWLDELNTEQLQAEFLSSRAPACRTRLVSSDQGIHAIDVSWSV